MTIGLQTYVLADPFSFIITMVIQMLVVTAITTGVSLLLAKRQKDGRKPAGENEFTYPTAIEGRPLPVVWGKRRVLSCNAITPIFNLWSYRYRKKGKTVSFMYQCGLHLSICHAADGVKQIWVQERCIWPNPYNVTSEAADAAASANLGASGVIFGGPMQEGGYTGLIGFQYGGAAQARDAYLTTAFGAGPAYRGFVSALWKPVYFGTTPYIKPMTFLIKRTNIFCDLNRTAMWYIAKANIGDDHCNAVHILYELITSTTIGAGKDTALIGTSFTTAADTCYTEGYGLDVVWDSAPDDVQDMIDKVCEIIDGVIYQDQSTGLYEIALARADYNPATLDTYDESYFWVADYEVPSPAKMPGKTVVHWHDRVSTKKRPAYDDDIALLEIQGASPVVREYDFSGFIAGEELANKVAAREQNKSGAMPKYLTLHCDRRMADKIRNDVFKISYTDLSITTMIVRVLTVDNGSLADGEVVLRVMEDVFGIVYGAYGAPPLTEAFISAADPQSDVEGYGDEDTGTVTWDSGTVLYHEKTYSIDGDAAGTTDQYVYFDPAVSETELQHSAVAPTSPTAYVLFENVGGTVTAGYGMDAQYGVEQATPMTDHWRFHEGSNEVLNLEHESGGAWTGKSEFGDPVP